MANDTGSAPAGTPAGGAPAAGGGTPAANWFDTFTDTETKGWVQAVGLKTPEAAAQKAWHLEKLLGADKAGRGVILPKDDKDEAAYNTIYAKLGRPEKPEGYGFKAEGDDAPLITSAATEFHKLGLTAKQAQGVMAWAQAQSQAMEQQAGQAEEQFAQKSEQEFNALKTKWGAESDKKIEQARRAARAFLPKETAQETMDKLERTLGTGAFLELFQRIGEGMGEHSIEIGGGGGGEFGMTPEAARLRLAEIKKDQAYVAAWAGGDAQKRAEVDKLNKIIAAAGAQ